MTIPGLIRALSLLLTAVITISFVSFVWDEAGTASQNQLLISRPDGAPNPYSRDTHGRMVGGEHSQTRLRIDDVADQLTSPAEALGDSLSDGNEWAMRGLAFLFGLAVFLFGLRALASWVELSGKPKQPPSQNGGDEFTPGYR